MQGWPKFLREFTLVRKIEEKLLLSETKVNGANCLIKKVLERVFVASNKKVLEIIETYRHWQQPVGGRDEADDATAAGSSG